MAEGLYGSRVRNIRIQAKYSSLLAAIPAFGQVGVLALGGYLVIHDQITLGTYLAFATYLAQLLAPVRMMANIIAVAQQTRAAADRIFDILDSNPVVTEKPDAQKLDVDRGEVVVEHVNFGYLRAEPVLADFSMRVAPGETVALVGMSGSGKSTVSLLLPRFYDVQSGSITIDGVDITDATLDSLRREVGVVFEDAFLFSDSVRNNIAYGRPDATDDDVRRAAQVAGAAVFIEALPDGYDTVVGERGLTLSGGQRQRIAIARAVLTDPRVLVLDDATSSIDARTEELIHATLREIMEHRTTILIAHRRSTLRLADRIIVMERGHAVEDGTHEELMATSARYRALLSGPGDDAEADAIEELVAAGGVTADLWRRDETNGHGARAFVSVAPVIGLGAGGAGHGCRWRRWLGMGTAHAGALQISPELIAAVEALPPADDKPDVDVAAEANKHETFRLRRFIRPYRKQVLIGFALIVADTILVLAGPLLVQRGLQSGVLEGSEKVLFTASAFFFLTVTADWLLTWTYTRYTGRTAERLLYALRIRIFSHLQRLALDYYDREMAGRIMTRMTTDVEAFSNLLQTGHHPGAREPHELRRRAGRARHPVVAAHARGHGHPAAVDHRDGLVPARVVGARTRGARDAISTVNAEFQENISGVRVAQAYVREGENIDSFRNTTDVYRNARVTTQQIQSFYFPLILFLSDLRRRDRVRVRRHAGARRRHHQRHRAHVRPVPRPVLRADPAALAGVRPVAVGAGVDDEDQRAHAHRGVHARPGASRRARPGRRARSSSTTCTSATRTPASRSCTASTSRSSPARRWRWSARPARASRRSSSSWRASTTSPRARSSSTARRSPTSTSARTVAGSGTCPRSRSSSRAPSATTSRTADPTRATPKSSRRRVRSARTSSSPSFPAATCTRSPSAGARCRPGSASSSAWRGALLVDPSILLLDEATANLDLSTEARVQRAMGLVASGRTTLLIAHRLPTARSADRIIVVDGGQIIEQGSHDELLALNGQYAELWSAFSVEPTAA